MMHSYIVSYSLFWTEKPGGPHFQKDLSDIWAEIQFRHMSWAWEVLQYP